jgi:hypothetical protein
MTSPSWIDRRAWPWIALFCVAFAPLVHDALIEKFFSADGAGYFHSLLETGRFTDFAWARNHAVYVVQWPVVLAMRAGVTGWPALEALFAVGLLLPFPVSFALCVAARRGRSKWPLLFPIASLLVITIPADYLLVGEHHVLVALAWPILLLALRQARLAGWELVVLAGLAVIVARTYESAVLVAPVLAGACVLRGRREPARQVIFGAGLAAYSILFPRDPGNRSAFLQALVAPARRPQVLIGMAFLVPFLLALRRPRTRTMWLAVGVGAIGAIVAAGATAGTPGWRGFYALVWAGDSFASRTLSMTLLPPLLVIAAMLLHRDESVRFTAAPFAAFALFAIVVAAVSLHENRQWIEFRSAFKATLATRTGLVPIESTPMAGHAAAWPWNNPLLSYLWSGDVVRAVVLNPADTSWEPFDPRTTAILGRYRQPPDFLRSSR